MAIKFTIQSNRPLFGRRPIRIDPEDKTTKAFFKRLGHEIKGNEVKPEDLIKAGISPEAILLLATIDGDDTYYDLELEPEEAAKGLALLDAHEHRIPSLFKTGFTEPNTSADLAAATMINNLLPTVIPDYSAELWVRGHYITFLNRSVPYQAMIRPGDLRGIHFSETTAPKTLVDRLSDSVVLIINVNGTEQLGSGVVVGEKRFVTAAHTMKKEFSDDITDQFIIRTREEDISSDLFELEFIDRDADIAVYKAKQPVFSKPVKIAEEQVTEGQSVWIVGYARLNRVIDGSDAVYEGRRPPLVFTMGEVESIGKDSVVMEANVPSGYSGGLVVNERGELIAIQSFSEAEELIRDGRRRYIHYTKANAQIPHYIMGENTKRDE